MRDNAPNKKVSVVVPVFNAEDTIEALLDSLLAQTRPIEEIVLVDDGSSDSSRRLIESYLPKHGQIRYVHQRNQGCAGARNAGWRAASGEICVFTDDDCLPEKNWLEEMLKPFADPGVKAVGGIYKTLRPEVPMASFIGLEFEYKYLKIVDRVDCHGTYSLAVYRDILEEVGGFNTKYGNPCADDWDLTYKISYKHRLIVQKNAVVGHYHPEKFWPYVLRTQYRRAYNRIRLYQDHPVKKKGDSFTNPWIPLYLFSTAAFFAAFIGYLSPIDWRIVAAVQMLFLLTSVDWGLTRFLFAHGIKAGLYGMMVQFFRNCAWILGSARSYLEIAKLKLIRSPQ